MLLYSAQMKGGGPLDVGKYVLKGGGKGGEPKQPKSIAPFSNSIFSHDKI